MFTKFLNIFFLFLLKQVLKIRGNQQKYTKIFLQTIFMRKDLTNNRNLHVWLLREDNYSV